MARWTESEKARLLACQSEDDLRRAFPNDNIESLKRRQRLFRSHFEGAIEIPATAQEETVPRSDYIKVLRERDEAKKKISEYVIALREAVYEAVSDLHINSPVARRQDPKSKEWADRTPEIAVAWASDWQLGKITPTYNSAVCEERVQEYAQTVIKLARIQNEHHPVRECRLYLTGDLVEGEGIFPTQAHLIDGGLYRQIANGIRILSDLILSLLTHFDKVHVVGVIGNHGSVRIASGTTDPETNMDRLLYMVVKEVLRGRGFDERLSWSIPEGRGERNWYAVDYVHDWGFLLMHGDQIRGGITGFWPSAQRKGLAWIDSIDEPWDYLMFGHHHQGTMLPLGRRQARCNGSTESNNTYAQEFLAAMSYPTQWVGFVHPERGITAEHWVTLGVEKVPNAIRIANKR